MKLAFFFSCEVELHKQEIKCCPNIKLIHCIFWCIKESRVARSKDEPNFLTQFFIVIVMFNLGMSLPSSTILFHSFGKQNSAITLCSCTIQLTCQGASFDCDSMFLFSHSEHQRTYAFEMLTLSIYLVHCFIIFSKVQKTEQLIVWHSFNALIMLNTAKAIELFTHSTVRDLLTITKQNESSVTPPHT